MAAPLAVPLAVGLGIFFSVIYSSWKGRAASLDRYSGLLRREVEAQLVVARNRRVLVLKRGGSDWGRVFRRAANSAFATGLTIFMLVLPSTIAAMAQAQDCAPASAGGYLLENSEVSCYDPAYVSCFHSTPALARSRARSLARCAARPCSRPTAAASPAPGAPAIDASALPPLRAPARPSSPPACAAAPRKPSQLVYKNAALAIGYIWISFPLLFAIAIFTGYSAAIVDVFQSKWDTNVSKNLLDRVSRPAGAGDDDDDDGKGAGIDAAKYLRVSLQDRQRFSWAFAVVLRENLLMGIATGFVYFTVSDSQVLASVLLILSFLCA